MNAHLSNPNSVFLLDGLTGHTFNELYSYGSLWQDWTVDLASTDLNKVRLMAVESEHIYHSYPLCPHRVTWIQTKREDV